MLTDVVRDNCSLCRLQSSHHASYKSLSSHRGRRAHPPVFSAISFNHCLAMNAVSCYNPSFFAQLSFENFVSRKTSMFFNETGFRPRLAKVRIISAVGRIALVDYKVYVICDTEHRYSSKC